MPPLPVSMPPQLPATPEDRSPDDAALDFLALRADLAAARRDPWRASLLMLRLGALRSRLAELRDWLASLPRRPRRGWARRWGRRWAGALPAAALLLALAGGEARAATITVDVGGGGNCSLAEAIGNANDTITGQPNADCATGNTGGADTIQFDDANTTYAYTSALPPITSEVTIQGNGNTTIQRDPGPDFRVLEVNSGGSLALIDLTITGGRTADLGSGVACYDATLSIVDSTISGNSSPGGIGGGIGADSCSVDIQDSSITDNYAYRFGGGILTVYSTVTISNSEIVDNRTVYGGGGGIYVGTAAGSLGITGSTISGNTAGSRGGGIAVYAATLTMDASTVSDNTAVALSGGGILVLGGQADISDSTVSGNTARQGGGVYSNHLYDESQYTYLPASIRIAHSTIYDNSALFGGGVKANNTTLTVFNSTISGNSATYSGGGVYTSQGATEIVHATITGNTVGVGSGGGIVFFSEAAATFTIYNSLVANQASGNDCSTYNPLTSLGYNLESGTSCGFGATGDIQNGNANLGPLADNGGPTLTHALLSGSGAIDQIPYGVNGCGFETTVILASSASDPSWNSSGGGEPARRMAGEVESLAVAVTDDQRHYSRPFPAGGSCDIGAYEYRPAPTPTPTPGAPTAVTITGLTATADPSGSVRITWETAAEVDVVGFRLLRAVGASGPDEDGVWTPVGGLIAARGGAAGGAHYAFTDHPGVGAHRYRLQVENNAGPPSHYGPVSALVRALSVFLPWAGG